MRSIQFRRDMRGQTTAPQSRSGVFSIGRRREKISAQPEKDFSFAFMHRLDCVHRVVPMSPGRLEIEFRAELVEKLLGRLFPNTHGAIALHVAVAADRTKT